MIDFSTQQLSWIVVGALGIGGTGYLSMTEKIDIMDKRLAVSSNALENASKTVERLEKQLNRIEEKIDRPIARR